MPCRKHNYEFFNDCPYCEREAERQAIIDWDIRANANRKALEEKEKTQKQFNDLNDRIFELEKQLQK